MINEKGVQPPEFAELDRFSQDYPELGRWFRLVAGNFAKINSYTPTLNPTTISNSAESVQTFTVNGLRTNDVVIVNKPTDTTDIGIVQAWVSDDDELSIKFFNHKGAPGNVDPPSEVYRIISIRL